MIKVISSSIHGPVNGQVYNRCFLDACLDIWGQRKWTLDYHAFRTSNIFPSIINKSPNKKKDFLATPTMLNSVIWRLEVIEV